MHMWKKLGIRSQITAGFVVMIGLMTLLTISALGAMNGLSDIFASYRKTTGQTIAISEYSDKLNEIQHSATEYLEKRGPEAVASFRSGVEAFANEDVRIAENADLNNGMNVIRKDVMAFSDAFEEIVSLEGKRQRVIEQVAEFGPWTAIALNDVMRSAWRQNDIQGLYKASESLAALNRSLYSSERFIHTGDIKAYDAAQSELKKALEFDKAAINVVSAPIQKKRLENAAQLMNNYTDRLATALDTMKEISGIREEKIDVLVPQILSGFAGLQAQISEGQKALDNSIASTVSSATLSAIVISALLIVAGLVLAWVIGSLISSAVRKMADNMERLAHGDEDFVIEGTMYKHELGAMARSLEVFQETGRAKLVAEANAERSRLAAEEERLAAERQRLADAEIMEQAFSAISEGLDALSQGNLSARVGAVNPRYEVIRDHFNSSVASLEQTIGSVVVAVLALRDGLSEISSASDDLAKRTEQQAASLEETVAALSEVTRGVNETAESAKTAQGNAMTARSNAEKGSEIVNRAIGAMAEIQESSSKIGNIIGVIDQIAFQTNLLALNAGVEAARAGEAGKGFAVVAQEVRELAQRSAEAAKEIKDLISTSSTQVDNGVELVSQTGVSLQEIMQHVVDMAETVGNIARTAADQAVGLREVSTAAEQMDQVTQQNAAMVEETTAAAQSLSEETGRLNAMVQRFQISDAGESRVDQAA